VRAVGLILVLGAFACRDEPRTTFLNERTLVQQWFDEECRAEHRVSASRVDWSSPRDQSGTQTFVCSFRGMASPRMTMTMTGPAFSKGRSICRFHVGPSVVRRPVSFDFLRHVVADDRLRAKIARPLAELDPLQEYSLDVFVDGVSVYAYQREYSHGVVFELDLNGCDRWPRAPSHDHWHHAGPIDARHWEAAVQPTVPLP
jgi:hypothetical protein